MRLGRRGLDRAITLLLFVGVVTWLLCAEGKEGFGRDEGQYMRAAEHYWGWFEELGRNIGRGRGRLSFSAAEIDRFWSDNAPDHPVIMKTLYGLSWRAFHRCTCTGFARGLHPIRITGRHVTLPLFKRESTAFRFPAILMSGLLAALVYRFARRLVPWPAAAAGAVLAIAQPHYFFHAPIACFDAPITTMAFALGFAYWKSLRSARWGMLCGLVFGIALGVKHNAWLMPVFLAAHHLWMRRGDWRRWRLPPVPLAFVSMAVLGPLIFFLHWPWLWHHPILRARTYLNRHLQHEHYNFEYLGRNWNLPPTDRDLRLLRLTFPFVSTGLTIPVTTLGLAVLGGLALGRRRRNQALVLDPDPPGDALGFGLGLGLGARPSDDSPPPPPARASWLRPGSGLDRAPGAFIAVQLFGPLAVLALPSTPIFGGVKHFMPATPYIAVAASCGLAWITSGLVEALRERSRQRFGPPDDLPASHLDDLPDGRADALPRGRGAFAPAVILWSALICVPAVTETWRSVPDGLSHYNMIAGGFAGGASLGMNRQFWAYCVLPILDWVNGHDPENQRMYWHDVIGDALAMYKREGRLAMSVGDTGYGQPGVARSAMGLMVYERHWAMFESYIWDSYGTLKPALVRVREGVPLVIGYERPRP